MRLLLVGVGPHREYALHSLAAAGYEMVMMEGRLRSHYGRLVSRFLWADARNASCREECVALAQAEHRRAPFAGVIPLHEMSVQTATAIAAALDLPGFSHVVADRVRNKLLAREALQEAGVPCPAFAAIRSPADVLAFGRRHGFPLILKPTDSGGSVGVFLVSSPDDAASACANVSKHSYNGVLLAESVLHGPEFSVEIVISDGRPEVMAVTEKLNTNGPYYVELGHTVPTQLGPAEAAVAEEACRAVRALGLKVGAAHVEVRLTEEGPRIIEVGGRLAGDLIPDLVELAYGVNPYVLAAEVATGRSCRLAPPAVRQHAGVRFLHGAPGRVLRTPHPGNFDELARHVIDLEVTVQAGDDVKELTSNLQRLGHVMAVAEARDRLEEVFATLLPQVQPVIFRRG